MSSGRVLREGAVWGVTLAVAAGGVSVLGLHPSFRGAPEALVIGLALMAPAVLCGLAGFRAAGPGGLRRTAVTAGALTGLIGGLGAGLSYVAFGKPFLNVPIGMASGLLFGALVGGLAGLWIRRAFPAAAEPARAGV